MKWFHVPPPYRQMGDVFAIDQADREVIARAFQDIVQGGQSYTDAAIGLYLGGIQPGDGGFWRSGPARWFFENPIHCGYMLVIPEGKEKGNPITNSDSVSIYPINLWGGPVVPFETWLDANPQIREKALIVLEGGV